MQEIPWNKIAEHDLLAVYETFSGYEIVLNAFGGKTHGMSDGVDMLFDANDEALSPGTPEFNKAMQDALEEGYDDYMEAYFPTEKQLLEFVSCVYGNDFAIGDSFWVGEFEFEVKKRRDYGSSGN